VTTDAREIERALCRIPEVTAARVVVDAAGAPIEVHILATPSKAPKQVVRDVQSVAMATFGVAIDHRVVSVVQLERSDASPAPAPIPPPPKVLDLNAPSAAAADDVTAGGNEGTVGTTTTDTEDGTVGDGARIVIDGVVLTRAGLRCEVQVSLRRGKSLGVGSAAGSVSASSALRLVAQATLAAMRELEPGAVRADIEEATVVRVGTRDVATASLVLLTPPNEEVLAGSALVRATGEHDAMARAVLDAANRRLPKLR